MPSFHLGNFLIIILFFKSFDSYLPLKTGLSSLLMFALQVVVLSGKIVVKVFSDITKAPSTGQSVLTGQCVTLEDFERDTYFSYN